MVAVLCVGLGGFIGSVGRYLLGLVPVEGDFPLMTFAVNFAGAVLMPGRWFEAATEGCRLGLTTPCCSSRPACAAASPRFPRSRWRPSPCSSAASTRRARCSACRSVLACLAGVVIGRLAVRGVRAALTGSAAA